MFKRLGGFALSGVMFPVKLVIFPVMAVVAVIHGVLFGMASTLKGLVRNIGSLLLLPFAPVSVLVQSEKGSVTEVVGNIGALVMGFGIVMGNIPNIAAIFGHPLKDDFAIWLCSHRYIVLPLTGTYLLSCLYEGGRAYANWLTGSTGSRQIGAKQSQAEATYDVDVLFMEANLGPKSAQAAPSDFLVMFNKIDDLKEISKADANIIGRELASMQKDGKLTGVELIQLARKASHITVA